MFNTILWATDGSDRADRALDYATRIAAEEQAPLHVAHVVERFLSGRAAGTYIIPDEQTMLDKIREQTAQLRDRGIEAELHTVTESRGHVPARIAEIADQVGADLIVVGTRGHSPVVGLMLGSVAQGLPHAAGCPVLTVPPAGGRRHGHATAATTRAD